MKNETVLKAKKVAVRKDEGQQCDVCALPLGKTAYYNHRKQTSGQHACMIQRAHKNEAGWEFIVGVPHTVDVEMSITFVDDETQKKLNPRLKEMSKKDFNLLLKPFMCATLKDVPMGDGHVKFQCYYGKSFRGADKSTPAHGQLLNEDSDYHPTRYTQVHVPFDKKSLKMTVRLHVPKKEIVELLTTVLCLMNPLNSPCYAFVKYVASW